jgi:rare lipoprotein A (peptidoglycan hydrolase)
MLKAIATSAATTAFIAACALPLIMPPLLVSRPVTVAPTDSAASVAIESERPPRVRDIARGEVVLGVEAAPVVAALAAPIAPAATPTPVPATSAQPKPPAVAAVPTHGTPATSGVVIASWYGPGFYGNRTACGQLYTPEIIGVAHRTLPCGTLLTIEYRGRAMTVPVIDRGPYIAGRTLDLSNATRLAMGCPDLCTLSMRIAP